MNERSNKFLIPFIAGDVFAAISILLSAITIVNLTRSIPFIPNEIERTIIVEGQQADVFILDLPKLSRHFL